MPRKIPDKTMALMESLYAQNLPVTEIAEIANVACSTAYTYTRAKQRGFSSPSEYRKHLAKKKGFSSLSNYQEHLAKKKGFVSLNKYWEHLAKQRQKLAINQELSDLIKQRLKELGKTQKWLAEQLEITEGSVSRYISCSITPRRNLQERLFKKLELNYQTLDDLL